MDFFSIETRLREEADDDGCWMIRRSMRRPPSRREYFFWNGNTDKPEREKEVWSLEEEILKPRGEQNLKVLSGWAKPSTELNKKVQTAGGQ